MYMYMLGISFFFVFLISIIFYFMSYKVDSDFETVSVYECGFEINSENRLFFSYRFFLISVLFLIFDVEIVLMLPAPMMYSGMFFLFFVVLLICGLVYEYYCGSLEWL